VREYYVYIIRCRGGAYYVGVTNNLEVRIQQHQDGVDPLSFTYSKRPVELVHYESFREINDAITREKQIKDWSRKKKEALIQENYDLLPKLAKKNFVSLRVP